MWVKSKITKYIKIHNISATFLDKYENTRSSQPYLLHTRKHWDWVQSKHSNYTIIINSSLSHTNFIINVYVESWTFVL